MFVCLLHPEIYKEALANPYYKYAYVKPPKPKSAMKKNLKHTKSRCQKFNSIKYQFDKMSNTANRTSIVQITAECSSIVPQNYS